MKLLLEPGASLLVLAVILYALRRFLLTKIPVIGGLLGFLAWPAMVFCVIGGSYLLFTSYRNRDA